MMFGITMLWWFFFFCTVLVVGEKKDPFSLHVGDTLKCKAVLSCICGGGSDSDVDPYITVVRKKYKNGVYTGVYGYYLNQPDGRKQRGAQQSASINFDIVYKGPGNEKLYINVYDFDNVVEDDELGSTDEFDPYVGREVKRFKITHVLKLKQCSSDAGECRSKFGEVVVSCAYK